jgi:hypothetical protein
MDTASRRIYLLHIYLKLFWEQFSVLLASEKSHVRRAQKGNWVFTQCLLVSADFNQEWHMSTHLLQVQNMFVLRSRTEMLKNAICSDHVLLFCKSVSNKFACNI